MKTIKTLELMFKLNNEKPSFKIVSTLEPNQFSKLHIPNSININKREDILERLDKQDEIIVYSTNKLCYKSRFLYSYLKHLDFQNVRYYSGGLEEWFEFGLPLAGSMADSLNFAA